MERTIKLNNGYLIPTIGLGTWKSEQGKVGEAVKYAILEAGYKHIDGAVNYLNEEEIGLAYEEVFKSVKREDIFITSKLWNTAHDRAHVEEACRKTLKDLHLDYLDLYLIHWGIAFKSGSEMKPEDQDGKMILENISIAETWAAMENLVKLGLVKSIGVANFSTMMLHDLLTYAKIKPVNNQIELHPYNSQKELISYCNERDIVVTAYSPLGGNDRGSTNGPRLFGDEAIKELSSKYNRSPSQILLNWAISRGTVAIPKSVTPQRIKENIQVYDFELSGEDIAKIDMLNKNIRFVDPSDWGIPYFK